MGKSYAQQLDVSDWNEVTSLWDHAVFFRQAPTTATGHHLQWQKGFQPTVLSMTLVGVTIAPSLSWEHHVESVISKANSRRYFLVVLRRAGVMPAHLVHFYITFIRPILEYAAPVWHPGLTQRQSHQLETVQRLALRSIYPALPYRLALLTTGLPRLADRRRQLCHDFANSAIESPDFRHWFPGRRRDCHGRELRNSDSLSIPRSTTRFRNSPIIFNVTAAK